MFVKIIRDVKKGARHETLYECCRASICERPDEPGVPKPNPPQSILVLDVGGKVERTIFFERDDIQIIYMNNNGRTIDRKVW